MIILNILVFLAGLALVVVTLISAFKTLVLPRGTRDFLTHLAFKVMWLLFMPVVRLTRSYEQRDRVMALYAPLTLMLLPATWLFLLFSAYMVMYWAAGVRPLAEAFLLSGSSLFTLGFARADTTFILSLVFTEAALGLSMVALLIAYLPAMYSAFQRREVAVNLLEVRAGSPPSAVEWIQRAYRINWLGTMGEHFGSWENWFADLEESHTSLSPLVFFRSPQADRSWITASGTVLDTAAIMLTAVDVQFEEIEARLCLRAGFLALRRISDVFGIHYNADATYPEESISISREEFLAACAELAKSGIPLKSDLDQSWLDYAGWRVNYDRPLLALAALIRAPYAPWSSDRSVQGMRNISPG
jgi:hypothetical protein